jgi:hypothetical protein
MLKTANRIGEIVGAVSRPVLAVTEPTDPDTRQKRRKFAGLAVNTARVAAVLAGAGAVMAKTKFVVSQISRLSGVAGSFAGSLSRTERVGQVETERRVLLFFKSKQQVKLSRSRLTAFLNKRDVLMGARILNSQGTLFETGGRAWHLGTTGVETSRGKQTITHLQSLTIPQDHFYFDRAVSNKQAVELANGRTKPEQIPGFVGHVSQTEALLPAWASTNQALILTRIHWPPAKGGN